MPFDQLTRNALAKMVGECRRLLTEDIRKQLQGTYGLQPDGSALSTDALGHLNDRGHEIAWELRQWRAHLAANEIGAEAKQHAAAFERMTRETAFTALNRLAALRLCEERGHVIECVRREMASDGFQLFERLTGGALGARGETYRIFLDRMFDELALDLGVLFDRRDPRSLVFPDEQCLERVLALLTAPALSHLWQEDETIGWIYQYFNDPAERKKMRESAAPRNSYELAVRNQFFTPRYVVEFLTDNTLGRSWYEMTRGGTRLKDECRYLVCSPNEIFLKEGESAPAEDSTTPEASSQEERLKQPVHIPHRPIKDPRNIRMLDPACGSMHFGLYAFDLFEVIYDEAWDLEESVGAGALSRPPGTKSLHQTYGAKDAFLKDVPRLIIEQNIHGIDIDPRCAQIAGLSLWLRAQKTWQRLDLKPPERPPIKRSNIVCAEPMPGEKELLREFVEREFPAEERGVFSRLLDAIFDKMQLAGEAGSPLKIEEEIRSDIAQAKKLWKEGPKGQQAWLFPGAAPPEPKQMNLDLSAITDEQFWERAEDRIYTCLRNYAEHAENDAGFQRRLFAEDAARGFAFINVCRKRYDVALMNPPFGQFPAGIEQAMRASWQSHANDIYVPFLLWSAAHLEPNGRVGAITSRNFLIGRDQKEFRPLILGKGGAALESFVDLGLRVLDGAEVDTATYVLSARPHAATAGCSYWDFRPESRDILHSLATLLKDRAPTFRRHREFWATPANLIAFSASEGELAALSSGRHLQPHVGRVTRGLNSSDDFRFLRLMWEIDPRDIETRWIFCAKGADYCWIVSNINTVVDWYRDGALLEAYAAKIGDNVAQARRSSAYYFRPAVTHTYRCDDFSLRALPKGCIFTNASPVISPDDAQVLPDVLALFLTQRFERLLGHISKKGLYETGRVGLLPAPPRPYGAEHSVEWEQLVEFLMSHERNLEQSPYFVAPAMNDGSGFNSELCRSLLAAFASLTNEETSARFIERATRGFRDRYETSPKSVSQRISYALGCGFGRWDIRCAKDATTQPQCSDPFAPLPVLPPGMLQNTQRSPAHPNDVPAAYPIRILWDGILVDDQNHSLDIERRVRDVSELIWTDRTASIEDEACEILGVKSLREYLRKPTGFFADHLKRYSKSRRQAPIYWPLSTASGSYILWIYYYRLTDQTLYACVNDFVQPKLNDLERDIPRLRDEKRIRDLQAAVALQSELEEFKQELLAWAPRWKPNLNDGVLITACPLWKLFRLPKWRKDLECCWRELERGDYDWAHLAYSLWPERVPEKCKKDRSIAIVHGLEEICEVEPPKPKKGKTGRGRKNDSERQMDLGGGDDAEELDA